MPAKGGKVGHVCEDHGDPSDTLFPCKQDHNSPACAYSSTYNPSKACAKQKNRGPCDEQHYSASPLEVLKTAWPYLKSTGQTLSS